MGCLQRLSNVRIATIALVVAVGVAISSAPANAATPLEPAAGATVAGPHPTFVLAMAPGDSFPVVEVATKKETFSGGFTAGVAGYCPAISTEDGTRASCSPASDLGPGTYYWLAVYRRADSTSVVTTPVRFTVSRAGASPGPTSPGPTSPGPTSPGPAPAPPSTPKPVAPPAPAGPTVAGQPVTGNVVYRPSDGGEYAFTAAEATPYQAARAVVHYVTTGLDAPPLNDDNGDGTPDYVQQVAQSADTALGYYAAHGFKLPLPDTAGPDARPDIYIKHFEEPSLFGVTIEPTYGVGGSFLMISSRLDQSPTLAHGSLPATVAHELFHVVQMSYLPNGMPSWVAEGSASGMELVVYPKLHDEVMSQYFDSWLSQPWRSLYDENSYCDHCYGGAWWWAALQEMDEHLLPDYLTRLSSYQRTGRPIGAGVKVLDEMMRKDADTSLSDAFSGFALALYQSKLAPGLAYTLHAGRNVHLSERAALRGLSMHYVPVTVPAFARGLAVEVPSRGGPQPHVTIVLGGLKGRALEPVHGNRLAVRFRTAYERQHVMLIVTSGQTSGTVYRVRLRSLTR